jgi:hypothetical protein
MLAVADYWNGEVIDQALAYPDQVRGYRNGYTLIPKRSCSSRAPSIVTKYCLPR